MFGARRRGKGSCTAFLFSFHRRAKDLVGTPHWRPLTSLCQALFGTQWPHLPVVLGSEYWEWYQRRDQKYAAEAKRVIQHLKSSEGSQLEQSSSVRLHRREVRARRGRTLYIRWIALEFQCMADLQISWTTPDLAQTIPHLLFFILQVLLT